MQTGGLARQYIIWIYPPTHPWCQSPPGGVNQKLQVHFHIFHENSNPNKNHVQPQNLDTNLALIFSKNFPTYPWNIPQTPNQQFMKEFLSFGGLGKPAVCHKAPNFKATTFAAQVLVAVAPRSVAPITWGTKFGGQVGGSSQDSKRWK